jgi:alpha-tubulin suppressor-like RCC1 family protein
MRKAFGIAAFGILLWMAPIDAEAGRTGNVSASRNNTCFITSTSDSTKPTYRQLYCFGDNDYGQLGVGNFIARNTPQLIPGASWSTVTVGDTHVCAFKTVASGGGLYCWGRNDKGQLGIGSYINKSVPTLVAATGYDWVSAGGEHTCARTVTDAAGHNLTKCWGDNSEGQLGDNTLTNRNVPTAIPAFSGPYSSLVTAGWHHTCGVRWQDSGLGNGSTVATSFCWGRGLEGQLGIGTYVSKKVPTAVTALGTTGFVFALGVVHTCASTGTSLKCWGTNSSGVLGTGNVLNSPTPTSVTNLYSGSPIYFDIGASHSCGVTQPGWPTVGDWAVRCWGDNASGEVGDGTTIMRTAPVPSSVPVAGQFDGVPQVATGAAHTCSFTYAQTALPLPLHWHRVISLRCWGYGGDGQVGNGTYNAVNATPAVVWTDSFDF